VASIVDLYRAVWYLQVLIACMEVRAWVVVVFPLLQGGFVGLQNHTLVMSFVDLAALISLTTWTLWEVLKSKIESGLILNVTRFNLVLAYAIALHHLVFFVVNVFVRVRQFVKEPQSQKEYRGV